MASRHSKYSLAGYNTGQVIQNWDPWNLKKKITGFPNLKCGQLHREDQIQHAQEHSEFEVFKMCLCMASETMKHGEY